MEDKVKIQNEFISLLLKNKDLVNDWLDDGPKIDFFDEQNHLILHAIQNSYHNDVLLTRKSFAVYLESHIKSKLEIGGYESLFNKINLLVVKRDDFPTLRSQIVEYYISKKSIEQVEVYGKDIQKGQSAILAAKKLHENLGNLVEDSISPSKTTYEPISEYGPNLLDEMKKAKNNPNKDNEKIECKIKEIDETMGVGFAPGSLTLFGSDVGNYKSTIMLNVAVNIWLQKFGVLFVPLEMPKALFQKKLLSRMAKVPFDKIIKESSLNDEEWQKLELATDHMKKFDSQFYILEKPTRLTVSSILREVEKHVDIFKPRLIVIDYVGILKMEGSTDRNDLQIGELLKELNNAGKPGGIHKDGFANVSGVQIGREALKRVRRLTSDKVGFFSEDLRGSHEYSADAWNIYAQMKDPAQPNAKLNLYNIKSRWGKNTFGNGQIRATLSVKPEISLIESINDGWLKGSKEDILKKIEDNNLDEIDLNEKEEDLETFLLKDKVENKKIKDDFDTFDLDG
jgi:replicative DNA helicase